VQFSSAIVVGVIIMQAQEAVLCGDIKKYAKDLDPTTGWERQPRHD
jgi:hypothetical protein